MSLFTLQRRGRSKHSLRQGLSRRGRFEQMEERLVLTTGLEFNSVVVAGGDSGVFPKAAATDAQGATYMGGHFYDTADFDLGASPADQSDLLTARGEKDAFVAKYAPDGSLEWATRIGGDSNSDYVYGLDLDSAGNLYIAGEFSETADIGPQSYVSAGQRDGFIAKLDPAGDFQWVQTWGGPERNTVDELVVDSAGRSTLIGVVVEDAESPDSMPEGIEIRQFDAAGNATWDYFLETDSVSIPDISVAASGDLVAVALFRGDLDLDLSDNEFIVSGADIVSNVFVLGLSSAGEFQWGSSIVADRLTNSSSSVGTAAVAVAADGSAAVVTSGLGDVRIGVGQDEQTVDLGDTRRRIFASFNSTGELQATSFHNDESYSFSIDVAAVETGFYVAGSAHDSAPFQPGPGVTAFGYPNSSFVMGVDQSGVPVSAFILGGDANDRIRDIRVGHDGNLLVTSSTSSNFIDFDPDPIDEFIHINRDGLNNSADAFTLSLRLPEPGQPLTVFGDSFENGQWNGKWIEDSQNDWFTSSQRATVGSYSAEVDGRATDAALTMATPLDLSGYASAELTFDWLIEKGFDSGEYLALDVFDGSSWTNDVLRLNGNSDPENTWHAETVDLTPYLSSNTLVRFRAQV
ncbi:MAG: SBBP repeat-containing protein, partial [Planctomycetota bacterium]